MFKEQPNGLDSKEITKDIIIDYIKVIKVSTDAYSQIVNELLKFQKKHTEIFEGMTELIDSPEKLTTMLDLIKEIDESIFYRMLEMLYRSSDLSNKVRKVFYLSIEQKKELVDKLNTLSKEIEILFKDIIKIKEAKEK